MRPVKTGFCVCSAVRGAARAESGWLGALERGDRFQVIDRPDPAPQALHGDVFGLHPAHARDDQRSHICVQRALAVPQPQLIAIQVGTITRGQRPAIVVQQIAFGRPPVFERQAGDQRVGQFPRRVSAPYRLPVQQSRPAVPEVDVAWVGVTVHDGVRGASMTAAAAR